MTLPQKEREAAEKEAIEMLKSRGYGEVHLSAGIIRQLQEDFNAGWSACLRESPTVKKLK